MDGAKERVISKYIVQQYSKRDSCSQPLLFFRNFVELVEKLRPFLLVVVLGLLFLSYLLSVLSLFLSFSAWIPLTREKDVYQLRAKLVLMTFTNSTNSSSLTKQSANVVTPRLLFSLLTESVGCCKQSTTFKVKFLYLKTTNKNLLTARLTVVVQR